VHPDEAIRLMQRLQRRPNLDEVRPGRGE